MPPMILQDYDRYRDWLISVLYLNTVQPHYYYCNCLDFNCLGTYQYGKYAIPQTRVFQCLNILRTIGACDSKGVEDEITKDSRFWLIIGKPERYYYPFLTSIRPRSRFLAYSSSCFTKHSVTNNLSRVIHILAQSIQNRNDIIV